MRLKINVEDYRAHTIFWLTLFQSGAGFTAREKDILTEILVKREQLSRSGIKEPYLTKLLFDSDARKEYCSILECTNFSLNNSFSAMKEKNIFDEDYTIKKSLIPQDRLEFEFNYDNQRENT